MIRNDILIKTSRLTVQTRYFILYKYNQSGRAISSHNTSYNKIATVLTDKVTSLTKQFDSVLGISEVRSAQSLVQTAEDGFMKSRRRVGETRIELIRLQNELRDLRSKLDRIPREDERYLQLATEEHKALIAERKAKTDLETFETLERDQFSALSAAVRAAHEKERSRAERTKYWSIIASACGAVLGWSQTSFNFSLTAWHIQ
jgi:chromosome segregation ATPase